MSVDRTTRRLVGGHILPIFLLLGLAACPRPGGDSGRQPPRAQADPDPQKAPTERNDDEEPDDGKEPGRAGSDEPDVALRLQRLPDRPRALEVQGAPVSVTDHVLIALGSADLDEDGDLDVLVLAAPEHGPASVWFLRRREEAFEPPRRLGGLGPDTPDCTTTDVQWRQSGRRLQFEASHRCPRGITHSVALLALSGTPRWLERLDAEPPTAATPWRLALAADPEQDVDEDGHPDWVVQVQVTPAKARPEAGGSSWSLTLRWLDRPGGLAPVADAAKQAFREAWRSLGEAFEQEADAAIERGLVVLGAARALCRGAAEPLLLVSGVRGVPCPGVRGPLGALAARVTLALLASGRWPEALALEERSEARGLRPPSALAKRLEKAWTKVAEATPVRWRRLEGVPLAPGHAGEQPLLGFLDATHLQGCPAPFGRPWVRQLPHAVPVETPGPVGQCGGRLVDPAHRWAAGGVRRDCVGYHVPLFEASGDATDRPVARLPLEERAPPPASGCPGALDEAHARDDGGWQLLGWAPQGLVVARAERVRVLPVTAEGRPAGDPIDIAPGRPLPAPILPPGPAAPDGSARVEVHRRGLLRWPHGPTGRLQLLRPPDWDEAHLPQAAAVGPQGWPLAVARGGELWLGEPPGATTTPEPAQRPPGEPTTPPTSGSAPVQPPTAEAPSPDPNPAGATAPGR